MLDCVGELSIESLILSGHMVPIISQYPFSLLKSYNISESVSFLHKIIQQ